MTPTTRLKALSNGPIKQPFRLTNTYAILCSGMALFSAIFLFLAALTANAGLTHVERKIEDHEIIKSPNDSKRYRHLTLVNDLQVMLISDPSADKASAALDVAVGSADDPKNFEGLAHFLEHMLFLGTEKYPEPDAYLNFINNNGGHRNASTALEHTNYYFDINVDQLDEALDRFSQQFVAPLFNPDYVQREVNAVHSEFSAELKSDGRRYFSALKTLLSKQHPYNKFNVGNHVTLADKPEKSVRDALIDFYNAHYSANRMRLVVLGKENLDQLEKMVSGRFSKIPNKNLPTRTIGQAFFEPNFLPAKVEVKTIMDTRTMMVAFPLPSAFKHRDSQPISYIANLIGHEGKGSLLSYLKEEELVSGLSAGKYFDTRKNAIFSITMSLSPKGLDAQNDILKAIFTYIDLIKKEGIKKFYFDEQAAMSHIAFKFMENRAPIHFTTSIARNLHYTSPQNVFFESYDLNSYEPTLIRSYLDHLKPENMLITLSARNVMTDQKSPWFETEYGTTPISADIIKSLKNAKQINRLKLPEENIFIPENTDLVTKKTDERPLQILSEPGLEVWHASDVSFGTPKSSIFITIRSPKAKNSALSSNATDLMVSLINEALSEFTYPAYLAGLSYQLYPHLRGMTLKINGYSEKQATLLSKILSTMKGGELSPERFELEKEKLYRALNNAKEQKPQDRVMSKLRNTIIESSWSEDEKLSALDNITFDNINKFRSDYLAELDVAVLSVGNTTVASSLNIASTVRYVLLGNTEPTVVERSRLRHLRNSYTMEQEFFTEHPDVGFAYYLQGKSRTYEERAKMSLLTQILSPSYFNEIRTNKQLGYLVHAFNSSLLELPGLAFVVQSPSATAQEILKETEDFLDNQYKALQEMSEQELNAHKLAIKTRILKTDKSLYQRANRYWNELDERVLSFDGRQQLVSQVEAVNKSDLMSFYQVLRTNELRKMIIYTSNSVDEVSAPKLVEGKHFNYMSTSN